MLTVDASIEPDRFINPQWIITLFEEPELYAIPGPGAAFPTRSGKYLLIVSGIVVVDVQSRSPGWHRETVRVLPDFGAPFDFVGRHEPNLSFEAQQYATYGSLNSVNEKTTGNPGFAVDAFEPFFSGGGRAIRPGSGIDLTLAVRGVDAVIHRVGYQLTAVGHFVRVLEYTLPPPNPR